MIYQDERYAEEWICYLCDKVSAKRITVNPHQKVVVKDQAAYGLITIQSFGMLNQWNLATPTLIHYGELTNDEYFVSESAAKSGVVIENTSATEPLVILKHFAENPELTAWQKNLK